MTVAICHLSADGSSVRLLRTGKAAESFTPAPTPDNPDEQVDPELAQRRIRDAAAWTAKRLADKPRLDVVCLAVDEALCAPLIVPSADPQVVAASLRLRQQEWGDASACIAEPLLQKQPATTRKLLPTLTKSRSADTQSQQLTVLQMHDGAPRLWLEELDKLGVRVGAVTTLWHTACLAWRAKGAASDSAESDSDRVNAAILLLPGDQLAWAWGRAGQLLAGGVASYDGAPDSETADVASRFARLTLDWLTWSAQLALSPDDIVVVGPDAGAVANNLQRAWTGASMQAIDAQDAIDATLQAFIESASATEQLTASSRTCVTGLTNRPGRAHRRLYKLAAAALIALAIGVAGLGVEFRGWAKDFRNQAKQSQEQLKDQLSRIDPALANEPFPVRALASRIKTLQQEAGAMDEPPPPRAILDEVSILAAQLRELKGKQGVKVTQITIGEDRAQTVIQLSDFQPLEALRANLASSDGGIVWRGTIEGQEPNVTLRLTGGWKNP